MCFKIRSSTKDTVSVCPHSQNSQRMKPFPIQDPGCTERLFYRRTIYFLGNKWFADCCLLLVMVAVIHYLLTFIILSVLI